MGFTHYWRLRKGEKKDLSGCLENIKKVLDKYKDLIQREWDDKKTPLINKNLIRFNGIGDNGYETFWFEYPPKKEESNKEGFEFNFCKTARKPYDIVVCECLLILKEYLNEDMKLSSDGMISVGSEDENWGKAIEEVEKIGVDIIPILVVDKL